MYNRCVFSIYTILLRKSILVPPSKRFIFCTTPQVFEWNRRFSSAREFTPKVNFDRPWQCKINFSKKCQISRSNFTKACAAAGHFSTPFGGSKCGRKVVRDCTGSSEVASGHFAFFRQVDFVSAGKIKIYFWGEFVSTRKTSISFKNLRSGIKNEALWGGSKVDFLNKIL